MEEIAGVSKVKNRQIQNQLNFFYDRLEELIAEKFREDTVIYSFDLVLIDNSGAPPIDYSHHKLKDAKRISRTLVKIAEKNLNQEAEAAKSRQSDKEDNEIILTSLFDQELEAQTKHLLEELLDKYKKQPGNYEDQIELIRKHLVRYEFNQSIDRIKKLENRKQSLEKRKKRFQFSKEKSARTAKIKQRIKEEIAEVLEQLKFERRTGVEMDVKQNKNPLQFNRRNNGLIELEVVKKVGRQFRVFNAENDDNTIPYDDIVEENEDISLKMLKELYQNENKLKYLYACKGNYYTQRTDDEKPIFIKFIIVIGFEKEQFDTEAQNYLKLHETSPEFRSMVRSLVHTKVSSSYIDKIRAAEKEIKRNATRAAISQVMARNGSHNIGSHVLADYVVKLENEVYNFYTQEVFQHTKNIEYNEKKAIESVGMIEGDNRSYQGLCINLFGSNKRKSVDENIDKDLFKIYRSDYHDEIVKLLNEKKHSPFLENRIKQKKQTVLEQLRTRKDIDKMVAKLDGLVERLLRIKGKMLEIDVATNAICHKYSRLLQSRFSSYIKTRMDFQADIASTTPTLQSTKYLLKDILQNFDDNRILLNRISGLSKNKFKFFINVFIKVNGVCPSEVGRECTCNDPHKAKDVMVSMPNDILGNHALFILLENIIRNSAKHGRHSGVANLNDDGYEFSMEVREPKLEKLSDYYEVYIYDSIVKKEDHPITYYPKDKAAFAEKCLQYSDGTIDMNAVFQASGDAFYKDQDWNLDTPYLVREIDKLVIEQNIRLNDNIIEENNQPRPGALGLIEMDVAATYLRNFPVEECDGPVFDIQASSFLLPYGTTDSANFYGKKVNGQGEKLYLLKALNVNNRLAYRFYLLKPKNLLVITSKGLASHLNDERSPKKLSKYGITVISFEQYMARKNSQIYNHEFLIFSQKNYAKEFDNVKYSGFLPYRRVLMEEKYLIDHFYNIGEDKEGAIAYNYVKLYRGNYDRYPIEKVLKTLKECAWLIWVTRQNEKKFAQNEEGIIQYQEPLIPKYFNEFKFESINTKSTFNLAAKLFPFRKNSKALVEKEVQPVNTPYLINFMNHGTAEVWKDAAPKNYLQPASNITQKCLPNYSDESGKITEKGYHLDWSEEWVNEHTVSACQIIESCIHSIGIIDERIQAFAREEYSPNLYYGQIFPKMNIIQPKIELEESLMHAMEKERDLDKESSADEIVLTRKMDLNTQEYNEAIYNTLIYWLKVHLKTLDTIIIHITVLEKCLKYIKDPSISEENDDVIKFFIEKHIRIYNPNINLIFTSGRGKPELLPEDEKYLPFSIISQSLCEKKSKYALMGAVVNARKLNKN